MSGGYCEITTTERPTGKECIASLGHPAINVLATNSHKLPALLLPDNEQQETDFPKVDTMWPALSGPFSLSLTLFYTSRCVRKLPLLCPVPRDFLSLPTARHHPPPVLSSPPIHIPFPWPPAMIHSKLWFLWTACWLREQEPILKFCSTKEEKQRRKRNRITCFSVSNFILLLLRS